ncbi:MAG: DUF58 domain-containing protein [Dehalococcoidia bacterium]|jgi:uncharacterized protein (DUF58 family)|nr:hypothetical protein [Chloroflexota bacterium]MCH2313553.1 DUF58 domain-containing protein [SAR202 cluster bacterium]MCS5649880.1 DUF58 domain-containing protein [Dehalococcoidia bacterium]MEC7913646.1 DUF58 domain-containing protein [Chloroflexota bacterium]HAT21255.1 hypothetical protein [Dehalococcoidia bacterium]|tara:strand:+ start:11587 stop:12822 length:1236 start_codon:yes stop_codon:yes gene_type:complete
MVKNFWNDCWVLIIIALVIIGIFSGQGLILGLSVMSLVVVLIAWLWNKVSLENVEYIRVIPQKRVFIGDTVPFSVELHNKKPIPLPRIDTVDDIPSALNLNGPDIRPSSSLDAVSMMHSASVSAYQKIAWKYSVQAKRRGFHRLGSVNISGGDIFGLFDSKKTISTRDYILVYPQILNLPDLGIPESRPLGEKITGLNIYRDISWNRGIRTYEKGDPLNTVDWKYTAKKSELMVKTFESTSKSDVILAVSVETSSKVWEGYSAVNLERVVAASASIASYCSEEGFNLGFFSNGTPVLSDLPMRIPASQSEDQLRLILETLATIGPISSGPMSENLNKWYKNFPFGSTVVVVTSFITDQLLDSLRNIAKFGCGVILINVADEPSYSTADYILKYELGAHFSRMESKGEFKPI